MKINKINLSLSELHSLNILFKANVGDYKFVEYYANVLNYFINRTCISDHSILNYLVKSLKKSGDTFNIYLRNISKYVEVNKFNILNYFNEIIIGMENLMSHSEWFNHEIYLEIRYIIDNFLRNRKDQNYLLNITDRFSMNSNEFHSQIKQFKYLFSIFDKLNSITLHMYKKVLNISSTQYDKSDKILENIVDLLSIFIDGDQKISILSVELSNILKSDSMFFIRKFRNIIEHDFLNPYEFYNFKFEIDFLFVLISQVLINIISKLMPNKQIVDLIKKNN